MAEGVLKAGAATREITPSNSQFLYGYPYVERMSTGAHDPLTTTALFIDNGERQVMFIANDILYLNKVSVANNISYVGSVVRNYKNVGDTEEDIINF